MRMLYTVIALLLSTLVRPSMADSYPSHSIQLIVPAAAGTNGDALARYLAPEMAKSLGQSVIVINKPGADSLIGFDYVAKQVAADGYTIVMTSVGNLAILPAIKKDLPFDPVKDLPPIAGFATVQMTFVAQKSRSWTNVKQLAEFAKANPGKLNYGSGSAGVRLASAALISALGINMELVNYPSPGPLLLAVSREEVDMTFLTPPQLTDKVRVLAVSGPQRLPEFPDAPTYSELGMPAVPGVDYSINAPAGVPKAALDKLLAAVRYAMSQPSVRNRLTEQHWTIVNRGPEEEAKNLAQQVSVYATIAKNVGLEPQ